MKIKVKNILLKIIKYTPSSDIRIWMFRRFLGYDIGNNVKIGKSFIDCKKVKISDNVRISGNNFIACRDLFIGSDAAIHSGNVILGNGNFTIGSGARIINDHFFDLYNDIWIGPRSWIAGKGSQFWTHGSLNTKLANKPLGITISSDVYIGSAVRFSPGTVIPPLTLVGMGSVVRGVYTESNTVISGNPAVIIKSNLDWRENW